MFVCTSHSVMNYMDDENDSIYFQQYENIYEYGGYGPWISYCLMQ